MHIRPHTSLILLLICLVILFTAQVVGAAQDPPAEAGEEAPAEAQPAPAPEQPPKLTGSIDEQIAQLSTQIEEIQGKIDELVFAKESDEREKLKREIGLIKRQLKQLLVQKDLNQSKYREGEEKIRSRYSSLITNIEAKKAGIRTDAISKYENLLNTHQESKLAPDIIFRLGMLYFEDDYYQYQVRQEGYLQQVGSLVEQGGDAAIGFEPTPDYSRAVKMFQQITENYPNFSYADGAFYLLAYCYSEQYNPDLALKTYTSLINNYPTSAYTPEAHIRKGEIFFDENQMEKAIAEYKEVLKHKDSKFYDKALFKLGWSYYRLTANDPSALKTAVDYFTQVLEYYITRPTEKLRGGDDLRQESVDYIAISFTDMDDQGIPAALGFIKAHENYKWNKDILSKMGEVYFERDRYDEARSIIEERIKRWPEDAENPSIHLKVVDALITLGRYDEAIAIGEQIATLYGPDTAWGKANRDRVHVIEKTQKQRATLLFKSATYHHEQAQIAKKEKGEEFSRPHFEKAAQSYVLFLSNFPESKDSYQASFNLAECYFDLHQYEEAASTYQKVVDLHKDKELFAHAVKNIMYSREQQFLAKPGWPVKPQEKVDVGGDGKGERAVIKTLPLSDQAEVWVASMEQHRSLLPENEDNPKVEFKIGEVYFYHGQFDKAVEVLKDQISRYPESEAAQVSMNLVIQALDRQGKYDELRQVAADYKNRIREKVIDEEKGTTNIEALGRIEAVAGAKYAEQLIKEGKLQEGINEYLGIASKNPQSDKAPKAIHNAAETYRQMGRIYESNDLYIRIGREYPDFELAKKDLFFAATEYEKIIDFDRAVTTYQLYTNSFPDDVYAKDALYNSALLRENNKDYDAAIALYDEYLRRYPEATDAAELAYNIVNLNLKSGNDAGAEAAIVNFTTNYNDAILLTKAYLEWGNLSKKRGVYDEATRHYMQASAVYVQASQVDPVAGAAYAAEAKFYIADIEYQTFSAINLKNFSTLEADLTAKTQAYAKLNAMYKEIVQIGTFEWATAALFMIGKINKDLAETLFTAPLPEELTPEEQDIYIVKLEEMAFPLKEKSISAFELNIDKGAAEKTRNKWIDMSYDEIKSYKPEITEAKYELYEFEIAPSLPSPTFGTPEPPPPPPTPAAPAPADDSAAPPADDGVDESPPVQDEPPSEQGSAQ